VDYPSVLDRWDIEKIKGRKNTYRVRIGRYRFAVVVNKEAREIEVAYADAK
jgi:mRNA-degrading endonuclease RelE of RelBE toxin-antitoxin system